MHLIAIDVGLLPGTIGRLLDTALSKHGPSDRLYYLRTDAIYSPFSPMNTRRQDLF
jgi:hypothetical protein